jgi:hypothetical protein
MTGQLGDTARLAEVFPPTAAGRRSWRLFVVVLLVVAVAAAACLVLYREASTTSPVLVVARPVPVGQPVDAADVQVVELRVPAGLEVVLLERAEVVFGRPAAVPLVPGALLAPGQVGPAALPRPGEVAVAVLVWFPPAGLAAGSRVRVLVTGTGTGTGAGAGGAAGGSGQLEPAASQSATVLEVGPLVGTGARVVTLLLPERAGERVATAAVAGRVALLIEAVG